MKRWQEFQRQLSHPELTTRLALDARLTELAGQRVTDATLEQLEALVRAYLEDTLKLEQHDPLLITISVNR